MGIYNKKATLSMTVLIISIICILVLVIMALMFLSKTSSVKTASETCEILGGECTSNCAGTVITMANCQGLEKTQNSDSVSYHLSSNVVCCKKG